MSADETLEKFLNECQEKYGYTHAQTKAILKKHQYSSFKPAMLNTYQAVIRAEWNETDEGQVREREKKRKDDEAKRPAFRFPDPIPCPVCGANTYGSTEHYGRWTKKPGWQCSKDKRHFGWVKCNDIIQQRGGRPLPWEKFENVTSPTYPTLSSSECG